MAKRRRRKGTYIPAHVRGALTHNKHKSWLKTLVKMQKGLCALCEEPLGDDVTLDHIIPTSKGGEDLISNCQAAHEKCNKEKGDMMPEEYARLKAGVEA